MSTANDGRDGEFNLSFSDRAHDGKYIYRGKKRPSESCALIFNSVSQSFVLDSIDDEYAFNLRETPEDNNAKSWAAQYPQIGLDGEKHKIDEDASPSNKNDPNAPGDPTNPYDYRHFMNKRRRTSSPEPPPSLRPSPAVNPISSPVPTTSALRPTTATRGRSKPHNSAHPGLSQPKPPHPKLSSPASSVVAAAAVAAAVREENTDADNEDSGDDNGGLTIDMGDDPTPRRRDRFMGAFGNRTPGSTGPRSLRSTASSVSPVDLNRGKDRDVDSPRHVYNDNEEDESEEHEVTMEELAQSAPSAQQRQMDDPAEQHDEADDGLEAELAAAMGESEGEDHDEEQRPGAAGIGGGGGDGGGVGLGIREEESEESEEE